MNAFQNWIEKLFPRRALRQTRLAEETDTTFALGARRSDAADRDRFDTNREDILRQSLETWRANPLARRIVCLTTQYVVGSGLSMRADDPASHAFLDAWWNHRLNQIPMRIYEWCDELTRSGELFLLVSTDAEGMSYVRAVPAAEIVAIETAENDLQQEIAYLQRSPEIGGLPLRWPSATTAEAEDAAAFPPVMLHYAINRPVGAVHGESDLAPLLRWLARYSAWLEDRARLNRYRNSFIFVVKSRFATEAERQARQQAISAAPPSPGSILVVDESESWEVINPQLGAQDAGEDGLALKKMLAAGAGLPLHFLAEPESATRSTAESAGGPTYRHFEQRQRFFTWLVSDLARLALERRAVVDPHIHADTPLQITGGDLSARDNAALAVALSNAARILMTMRDRGIIDDAELLRLAYRFGGEVIDVEEILRRGREAGPLEGQEVTDKPSGIKISKETGEITGIPEVE